MTLGQNQGPKDQISGYFQQLSGRRRDSIRDKIFQINLRQPRYIYISCIEHNLKSYHHWVIESK